jgi:hypothetical protein
LRPRHFRFGSMIVRRAAFHLRVTCFPAPKTRGDGPSADALALPVPTARAPEA